MSRSSRLGLLVEVGLRDVGEFERPHDLERRGDACGADDRGHRGQDAAYLGGVDVGVARRAEVRGGTTPAVRRPRRARRCERASRSARRASKPRRAGGHVREQIEDGGVSRLCHGSPLSRGAADAAPGSVFSHSNHDEKHMGFSSRVTPCPRLLVATFTAKPVTGLGESTSPTLEFTQVNRAHGGRRPGTRCRVCRPRSALAAAVTIGRSLQEEDDRIEDQRSASTRNA